MSPKLIEGDVIRIIHRIRKISAEGHSPVDILKLFRLVAYAGGKKWFFIDEINGNDVWRDVLIDGGDKDSINAYFKDKDGALYTFNFNFDNWKMKINPVLSGSFDDRHYHEKLGIVRNQYSEISARMSFENQEITAEQIKNIEDMLTKSRKDLKDQ